MIHRQSPTYFNPWETIHEGNPQEILERREPVTLAPVLIMQGALDDSEGVEPDGGVIWHATAI